MEQVQLAVVAQIVSIVAFAWYGVTCLVTREMVAEFDRYGLARFRTLTGALQLAGSLGLIVGFYLPPLLLLSAGGLTALMLSGIVARVRIRDPLVAMLPAFAFFCLNLFITISAL